MKKKRYNDLLIILVILPVMLFAAFFIANRAGSALPSYSVINKSANGFSIFYEVLSELDHSTSRSVKALSGDNNRSLQLVVLTNGLDIQNEALMQYVFGGGLLICLGIYEAPSVPYAESDEAAGIYRFYRYGKGAVLTAPVNGLTNGLIVRSTDAAWSLYESIEAFANITASGKEISFNEFNLFNLIAKRSLWESIPPGIKLILYHFLIMTAAFIMYKGRRFGKPVPLYEEAERSENEYLYSISAIYRHAGCYDLLLQNYYRSFLNDMINVQDSKELHNRYDWTQEWKAAHLPHYEKARKLYDFMQQHEAVKQGSRARSKASTGERKKYLYYINIIEELRSVKHFGKQLRHGNMQQDI